MGRVEKENLISFVIPCYRSEDTIERVCAEIAETVALRPTYDYEIIAVNDCSPDGVLKELKHLAAADERIRVIDLAKNFGKHCALMAGLNYVKGELVTILDDDFQCPTPELWRMVDAIEKEGYDCVTAVYEKKKESLWKISGAAFNKMIISWLLAPPKGIEMENFAVFRRYICDEIVKYQNPYPYMGGLIMRSTHRIKMLPMEERARGDDKPTGFTFRKSFSLFANGLTAFSVKPLRIASLVGVAFALLGFVYGLFIIIRKLAHPEVMMGYSSLMAVQLFSSGIVMLLLGVIGEYIGRIYISLNRAPQYVVRETINMDGEHE